MAKRLGEKVVLKTKVFTIKDVDLEFDNGEKGTFQVLEKKDVAIIVPLDAENNIILIKEYFTAINEYQYDLPGGRIEEGHDELETANKELQEEVGFKANRLDKLITVTMSPGYLTQKAHIFLARELEESSLKGDEKEKLEILKWPFDKFEELINSGKITEARAIAALFLARRFLNKESL